MKNQKPRSFSGRRLGLLCNHASVDARFHHAAHIIEALWPGQLKAIFSPQHGFYAEKQDNMIESGHSTDPLLNIPVFSLYSDTRKPTAEMMSLIDVLIVDLQDAGCRVYTFIYTLSYCLEAAAAHGTKVVVLDRPNPVGGRQVEGNLLEPAFRSFVGRFSIPMRYGLTIGETARLFNSLLMPPCDLEVVPMCGWRRDMYFGETGLSWIPPSPNLPKIESCMVYPGQVLFEGTNISEGRGTTLPFEIFGAPFLDTSTLAKRIDTRIKGAHLRRITFEPTAGKWRNQTCHGFHIHVTDRDTYTPYRSSLVLLQEIIRLHGDDFRLKEPPYEYEYEKTPLDLIIGSRRIRENIMDLNDIDDIEASWQKDLDDFIHAAVSFHLYE